MVMLSSRLSLMLMGVFLVIGTLLVAITLHMPKLPELVAIGAQLVAAAIAFALLAALLVFNLLTRRLHLLADAMEAFRAGQFGEPIRLAWARPDGDEIDRVAHVFGDLSHHIARQLGELERADTQRRELLANISHDLRTPLTLMQGYLETMLLRQGEMSAREERACIEVAARHAERLGRLVGDLFELAKLDGAHVRVHAEPFSLTELAQDIAQKFELPARERRVRLALHVDANAPPVCGDIGLVERALENLVDNALRHTPAEGCIGLEVEGRGASVQVRVSDTGCGIARENLPYVFDRYFRAPRVEAVAGEDPRERADGLARHHAGLGLAITRRIVALHGADIRVSSALGVGTTFSFDLAVAAERATHDARKENTCPSASSSSSRVW